MSDLKEKNNIEKMSDRRKQIQSLFDGADDNIRRRYGIDKGSPVTGKYTYSNIDTILSSVGNKNMKPGDVIDLSNYAYATDPNYAAVIDYLANMFLWRYYYFPVRTRDTAKDADYKEMYQLMTEVVDGLNIEIIFPTLITKILKEGVVYLYTTKNTSSKTISTILLNPAYCKPVMISQYGTGIFQFDVEYFDDLGFRKEELEEVLEVFPKELVQKYREFKTGGPKLVVLDGRYSTYVSLNDYGFPTRIRTIKTLLDYDKYRENELERNSAQLDKFISHKIPQHDGRLLFELDEVRELHRTMAKQLGGNKRLRLITSFGDIELHNLMPESRYANEVLEKAQENIYRSSGLNIELFSGKTEESLRLSLTRDQSNIWRYIAELINFYNLAINNLFNFKGFQIELTMLPITHFNLKEMMEIHRRNAEYGIGRLEAVVASGTKQKHILYKGELEDHLKLDEILKPLASSHTQSSKDREQEKEIEEKKPKEVEVEKPKDEDDEDGDED